MIDEHCAAGAAPARFDRRRIARAAGMAAAVAAGRAAPADSLPAPKPNIVLIVCDDLATSLYNRLGPLRREIEQAGLRFANAVAAAPSCAPARAAILTGRYPHNTGVLINTPPDGGWQAFRAGGGEASSLGPLMREAGYRTALIGKYLNEYETAAPSRVPPGWDRWHAWAGGGQYDAFRINDNGVLSTRSTADGPAYYETDWFAALAREFVEGASGGKPFFLYLAPHAPHMPAIPAERHRDAAAGRAPRRSRAFNEADVSDKPAWIRGLGPLRAAAIRRSDRRFSDQYRTMLAVGDLVRDLLRTLRRTGQLANTWIFLTSDNGLFYGEHRIPTGKGSLYEEGIQVPLVVRGPGAPRGVSDLLVSGVDLLPTILDLAGGRSGAVDGRSFAHVLTRSPRPAWRGACFVRFGLEP
ncbi:MAG: sulfatase, partial [Chloroflexota bacterium]